MKYKNRPSYQFTQENPDGRFSRGPVPIVGQQIFIDPNGPKRAVVRELAQRQLAGHEKFGMSPMYRDGVLVSRTKNHGIKSGMSYYIIADAYKMEDLDKLVDELLT